MKLSTKGRYAVTAMLDLAIHDDNGPVTLADISRCQGISLSYLEQLFARLRAQKLVKGVRGPGGGYYLARNSRDISIEEIIAAVDESVELTGCGGKADCLEGDPCLTHDLWSELSDEIRRFLGGISLADMVSRGSVRAVADRQDVHHARVAVPEKNNAAA